jgi:hypothetical protein
MGHCPSIMGYCRFNYVAQPEDEISTEDLFPRVGPRDAWAIRWGYAVLPGADSPDAEGPTLDQWSREQESTPWLRFAHESSDVNEEAVGDADPLYSTAMGLKNLHRVMGMLASGITPEGQPYDELKEIYDNGALTQWGLEMGHVANMVGQVDVVEKYAGQNGGIFTPISYERQRSAVHFLAENAFKTRQVLFLVPRAVLSRIESSGALDHVRELQKDVLTALLRSDRLGRLIEWETLTPSASYKIGEFLGDLHAGVWGELKGTGVKIDPYRRNLQRNYTTLLIQKLTDPDDPKNIQPYCRSELKSLGTEVRSALTKATDPETRAHLDFTLNEIQLAVGPRVRSK